MSADLSSVLAGKAGVILCPLCLREFSEPDIENNLTEEHIIPSSAGGTTTTLTCRTCNSECGTEIDSHFARAFRIEEARRTGGEVDARIKIRDSVGAPVKVRFAADGVHCHLEPTTKHAKDVLLDRLIQYARGERALNFNYSRNIDTLKLVASMIKAAYLGLFVDWGYRYVVLPNRDWVRTGIRRAGPERECLGKILISATITGVGDLDMTPTRMSFDAVCGGINVACSVINGVLGANAFCAFLPPMFDLNTGSCVGLARAVESIRGKSVRITFNENSPATIQAS